MKLLKWGGFLFITVLLLLGTLTLHPDMSYQLETNFRKNIIRSFKDSGMQTRLSNLDLSIWPLIINWSFLKIERPSLPDLPNSWVKIFHSIELSDCDISVWPGWFRLHVDLDCKKIDVQYIPLQWYFEASLKRAYALDFFYTDSDFENMERKQGWWVTSIKADYLFLNGKAKGPFNFRYQFISQTVLEVEWLDTNEKILFSSEPEHLRIHEQSTGKNFGFLNTSLYAEIMPILRADL
jgi:hypothetical protein